jgi:D-alanine transaminase
MLVYLNGSFIPNGDARISVDDRGFVFADGIYEVIRVYDGRLFMAEAHAQRMRAGLGAIRIQDAGEAVLAAAERLLDENDLRHGDATIYIQITRGVAPRRHAFPEGSVPPTVYVTAKPFRQHPTSYWDDGVAAITVPDTRWSRCDIKSISLLPNVLANQAAREAGAFEALFVRDGVIIEGSHSNLFAVLDGEIITYPECNYILPGITRRLVLELARELALPVREGHLLQERMSDVEEMFLTGTTTEVMPVTRVDAQRVADGRPGPVARRLQQAFRDRVEATRPAAVG